MTLPTLATEQSEPANAPGDAPASTSDMPLAGVRVLAVDDEPDWRELLGHILGAAGADARIAASAAEAIQIFEAWRPDVVLTDIAMPVTDGYGLLSSIRGRGGAGRAVPAIAMTAHAGAQERNRTARAGFAEHLAKPIPPHELMKPFAASPTVAPRQGCRFCLIGSRTGILDVWTALRRRAGRGVGGDRRGWLRGRRPVAA